MSLYTDMKEQESHLMQIAAELRFEGYDLSSIRDYMENYIFNIDDLVTHHCSPSDTWDSIAPLRDAQWEMIENIVDSL